MDRLQVVSRWFVGDVTRDGHASSQAWASFGFDLDGATYATPTMEGHCVPSDGTSGNPAGAIVDGVGGIDNAFGERLLGPVPGVALPSSVGATQAVTSGRASLLLDLGKEGAQSSYEALSGSFSTVTGDPATPPTASALADGSYPWHRFSFVEVASSPSSYSVSGTWVSAPPTTITVALPVQQGLAFLRIHHATVTLTPVLGQVVGNLGGVLDPTELASAIVLARGVCDDTSALATTLAGYADVMLDGTQSPGVPCEGISIGLGFATAPATLGAVATIPAPVDPCAP